MIATEEEPDEFKLNDGETATKDKLPLAFRTFPVAFKAKDCPFKVEGEQNTRDILTLAQNEPGLRTKEKCLEGSSSQSTDEVMSDTPSVTVIKPEIFVSIG
jgi:hypothetical protein